MSLLIALSVAFAGNCDAKALTKALQAASPTQIPTALHALRACDTKAATKEAPAALRRLVASTGSSDALLEAIELGVYAPVTDWIKAAEPGVRSQSIEALSAACASAPEAVTGYFLAAEQQLGERFWTDRWYRGLGACHTPEAQSALKSALESSPIVSRTAEPRSGFYSVLDVWARNVGADAIPQIADWITSARDEQDASQIVSALGDAARLGSSQAADPSTIEAIRQTLESAAPNLPLDALGRGRNILIALDQTDAADALAAFAWPAARQADAYTYALSATEHITCKNGKTRDILHTGLIETPANQWPDEVLSRFQTAVEQGWALDRGSKCKGTGTLDVTSSDIPLDAEAQKAFIEQAKGTFVRSLPEAGKPDMRTAPTLSLQNTP